MPAEAKLNWDGHSKLREQYDKHAAILDQPAAALITDLKQRGILQDTLVVWCTEFGRMPCFKKERGTRSQSGRLHLLDDRRGESNWCKPRRHR